MKVQNWLSAAAAANPQREAVVAGQQRLSYGQLDERAVSAARRLRSMGVGSSDRVGVALPAGADFAVVMHGLIKLGAQVVPIDPAAPSDDDGLAVVIRDAADLGASEWQGDIEQEIDLDSVLCEIRTSGSSGAPKAVALTSANHLWSAVGCGMRIGMTPEDRWLCCLPVDHVGGLAILVRCAIFGATAVIERFEAERTAATLARERITTVSLVATMLDRLLDAGTTAPQLRCALLGGGPAPPALIDRALASEFPIAPTYGLTEACSQVTTLIPDQVAAKRGSAGKPIASTRIRIGEDGRIEVAGPTVAPGAAGADGWLRTGDLGRIDADGHLHVVGRADELIVTGGENVSPEEVEQVLIEHPAISDAAVIGRHDPQWQQAVVAIVVLDQPGDADSHQLRAFCRERLPGFKVPKRFEFVEQLPRNAQGKLLRAKLR